jgi:ubiquinone/menaquinone biosynthesis C-methylase UbiE
MTREVQKYFDEESDRYEDIRWRGSLVSRSDFRVTREALTPLVDKSELFLDMGCGTGVWLEECLETYEIGVGVDLSRKMLELCKRRRLPSVNLVLADCHRLPFRDCVFDAILSSRVFIYLNLETALSEAKRVLRDEGGLVLLVQIDKPKLVRLRDRLERRVKFLEDTNYLTAHELIGQVSRYFRVIKTKGVIFRENMSKHAVNIRLIAFLLNHLYLGPLYALEKQFSASFLKYFYASSIVIKARKT